MFNAPGSLHHPLQLPLRESCSNFLQLLRQGLLVFHDIHSRLSLILSAVVTREQRRKVEALEAERSGRPPLKMHTGIKSTLREARQDSWGET